MWEENIFFYKAELSVNPIALIVSTFSQLCKTYGNFFGDTKIVNFLETYFIKSGFD